ncbi:ATP-dependent RNA helicase DDX1-like [Watersipora subatra]|uniref:ATP-dependent RNA helicase DDX1-like n=1 Tax=Watersipora subatra TaxID=2589382 RepID=UPI00355C71CC
MTAFAEMGIMPELGAAVEEMDWMLPTDVQAEAIPLILGGGDVLMAAETGSGKTGAFCLPVIQIVWESMKDSAANRSSASTNKQASAPSTGNEWRMNVHDRGSAMAIDGSGLLCQSRDQKGWHGTRATMAVCGSGKYYYEAIVTDEGLCRVGWATEKASLNLGTDKHGFGFGGTGKKSNNKNFDDYGEAFGQHDVIGCYIDLDSREIAYTKNGKDLDIAFEIPANMQKDNFYPAVVLKNAEMKFNFGGSPFKYEPVEGHIAIDQASARNSKVSAISGSVAVASKVKPPNAPYAIVMEPSRELADQTHKQVQLFKKKLTNPGISELLCVGGMAVKDQIAALRNGVDIVCGTPGRLEDLITTGNLDLSQIRFFILDEADGLLSQGYSDLINRLHAQIPKVTADGKRLQMVVCSATLHSPDVRRMADKLMNFPVWIDLKGQDSVPDTVHHVVCRVDPHAMHMWKSLTKPWKTDGVHAKDKFNPNQPNRETLSEAVKMMKGELMKRAIDEHHMDRAIIFCRTKLDCDNAEEFLTRHGGGPRSSKDHKYSCVCLHSDRNANERRENLDKFKRKDVRFLICTDVAARGLDVRGLPFVINVTLPDEKQNYVHRIGRVGRAERMGLAISLVSTVSEKVWYHSNCRNRGKGCYNTNLTERGGCCIWYDEPALLANIEEHLGVTIDQAGEDLKIAVNEFDGKVTYGQKRKTTGSNYKDHVDSMAPVVSELALLEQKAQTSFLQLKYCPVR